MLLKPTASCLKEDESRIEEEEQDNNIDDEYLAYLDSITEKEEYAEEANWEKDVEQDLPQTIVKSLKLQASKVNSTIHTLIKQVIEEEDKNLTQLQTFYEQREWLLALPQRIFEETHLNMQYQIDSGLNSHILNRKEFMYK